MRSHGPKSLQAGALTLCLLLLASAGSWAQDQPPRFPFQSIAGDGAVGLWGDFFYRLSFDADFRLDPKSNGIELGDDVQIVTALGYPTPDLQGFALGLPVNRLVVRLAIDGQCFKPRGRKLLFRAPDGGAIADCTELGIRVLDGAGGVLFDGDFDLLQSVSVELAPAGQRGRWKLRSVATFADPGFPFPVVGYGYDAAGRLTSGVTVIIGDDAGFSTFRAVGFRTLAP